MRPRLRVHLAVLALAFGAIGSVVQASIRRHHHHRHHRKDVGHPRFDIVGRVAVPLQPGMTAPIDVALSNRIRHDLWISDLQVAVTVDAAHAAAGCSATRDYVVTQLPHVFDPILLPARRPYTTQWPARLRWPGSQRWRLRDLGVPALPTISMLNLRDVDQDGCKGAKLALHLWATSHYHPPYWRVRPPRRAP
jgi:hypothetical protein